MKIINNFRTLFFIFLLTIVFANSSVLAAFTISEGNQNLMNYAQSFGPSTSKTYLLSGNSLSPLSGIINFSGLTNFEISTDEGISYGSTSISYSNGTFTNQKIMIRLKEGLKVSSFSELINVSGGASTPITFNVAGNVNDIPTSFEWSGAFGNDFLNNKNWVPFGVPDANDNVNIVGVANIAIIDQNQVVKLKSVTISQGGELLVNTSDTVTINGNFSNYGTFQQINTGEILFAGNWESMLTTGIQGFITSFTNVIVDKGINGTLECNTPIKVANTLRIKSGHFIITGQ